jgi:hypothetical protein
LGFANSDGERDQETQDIFDSKEDEADRENELLFLYILFQASVKKYLLFFRNIYHGLLLLVKKKPMEFYKNRPICSLLNISGAFEREFTVTKFFSKIRRTSQKALCFVVKY